MSTSSRSEIERKRDQAQRERANMAQIANDQDGFPRASSSRSLFEPPSREDDEIDQTTQMIESLFGRWKDVKWESGNPVMRNENGDRPVVQNAPPANGNNSSQHGRGEHRQPAPSASSSHSDSSRDRHNNHSASNHHRGNSEQRHEAAYKNHSHEQTGSSSSSSAPRSSSYPHKHAWHSSHSRSSMQTSSQGSSSHSKPSPLLPQHSSGAALPGRGTPPERDRPHHARELAGSTKHVSDQADSHLSVDRKSRVNTSRAARGRGPSTPPCSPPPNHSAQWTPSPVRTPPPSSHIPPASHRTPPPSHRTTPPVRHTPPVPHQPPHPPAAAAAAAAPRTPPPSQSTLTHSDASRPSLTLNIKRENKSGELDDIFKEMAVTTPLTALSETPVKCKKAPLFQFAPKLELPMGEDLQLKPPLSPLPEPDNVKKMKEEAPTPPVKSSISEDLEVSDDSDLEMEEKQEEVKEETPMTAPIKKEVGHSSSDESSSSDSSSASDSESSSSESEDDNDGEEEVKEEVSADKEKSKPVPVANTPPEKTKGSWGLSQFITKTSPASVLSSSQTSTDLALGKGGSSQDGPKVKASPRKMSEIGPCESMPFIVHDDSDPLPRNCEKPSTSPDTLSTPSSHTSSLDTGRGSQNKARRDSAGDSSANNKLMSVSKPEVARGYERSKASSTSNSRESAGAGASRPATDSIDTSKGSGQQCNHRRTSSSGAAARVSKTQSVIKSPSAVHSSITVMPEAKSASGKRLSCDAAEQQAAGSAGGSGGSGLPSSAYNNKKTNVATKPKVPSQHSIQNTKGAAKSATKRNLFKENMEDSKSSSTKAASNPLTDIGSIMKDVTVPPPLSPTIPAYSGEVRRSEPAPKGLLVPTQTCGKPSIVVCLRTSLLSRSPRTVAGRGNKKQEPVLAKKESGVAKLTGSSSAPPVITSECKGGENKQPCVKSASGKTSSGVKKKNCEPPGLSPSPPSKRKKKADTEDGSSSKKQKVPNHINKSSPEINGVAHPEEVKKAGIKRMAERRGSASSSSSRSSQKSGARDTSVTKGPSASKKARKWEPDEPFEEKVVNGMDKKAANKEDLPFNSYKQSDNSPKHTARCTPPPPSQPAEFDYDGPLAAAMERLQPQDFYMLKAKELKHMADKKQDKPSKLIPYLRSELYFIMWGHAYEKQAPNLVEPHSAYTIYMDTLSLHQYVNRLRISVLQDFTPTDRERKLSVLILRIQSILCLKMYSFRRNEVMKLKKIIDSEPNKNSSMKMSAHAPSPHQNHWNKNSTGTPSPMSPTPSPACSIGSVESQGSCEHPGSKMTNGTLSNGSMSSPGTIAVSQRIHSVTQRYISFTANLLQCHECWDTSVAEIKTYNLHDFFQSLDERCGILSINSSLPQLVFYVYTALKELS